MRATRKAGEIPRTTGDDSAYNNVAMDKRSSFGSARGDDDGAHIGIALVRWQTQ